MTDRRQFLASLAAPALTTLPIKREFINVDNSVDFARTLIKTLKTHGYTEAQHQENLAIAREKVDLSSYTDILFIIWCGLQPTPCSAIVEEYLVRRSDKSGIANWSTLLIPYGLPETHGLPLFEEQIEYLAAEWFRRKHSRDVGIERYSLRRFAWYGRHIPSYVLNNEDLLELFKRFAPFGVSLVKCHLFASRLLHAIVTTETSSRTVV